ncbi:hypothetical protein [Spirosoma endbachense]|uniref:hypothetical protein n=1 Tax=Spirosoma endbachense TaxID=2666025 RepID=UPI001E36B9CF|nr:hypothetical protein [Spirosoma endbachense]
MVEAESPAIVESVAVVESDIMVEVESVEVVSVSVFFELQEVARAIIAMKKKADFVIAFISLGCFCLRVINGTMSTLIRHWKKGNPIFFNFFLGYVRSDFVLSNEAMQ